MIWTYINHKLEVGDPTKDKVGYYYGKIHKEYDIKTNQEQIPLKLAIFDLDYTLIVTKSGNTFAKDENDWTWYSKNVEMVCGKLYGYLGYKLVIVTNQAGIKQSPQAFDVFRKKMEQIVSALQKSIPNLELEVYCMNNKDIFRKPFPTVINVNYKNIDMRNSFFCGDAIGISGDHSAADIGFAYNLDLMFYTPEELMDNLGSCFIFRGIYVMSIFVECHIINIAKKTRAFKKEYEYIPKDDKPEFIIMVGYPGSGKSYIANKIRESYLMTDKPYEQFIRSKKINIVSLDALKTRPKLKKEIEKYLNLRETVIIDNTSPTPQDRKKLINILDGTGFRSSYNVRVVFVNRNREDSFKLNCYRYYVSYMKDKSIKFVPELVYKMIGKTIETPNVEKEGIDVLDVIDEDRLNIPCSIEYMMHFGM